MLKIILTIFLAPMALYCATDSVLVYKKGSSAPLKYAVLGKATIIKKDGSNESYRYSEIKSVKFLPPTPVADASFNDFIVRIGPNPASELVCIDVETESAGLLTIRIKDIRGLIVFEKSGLIEEPGVYSFEWDFTSRSDYELAAGAYFCETRFNEQLLVGKIIYLGK